MKEYENPKYASVIGKTSSIALLTNAESFIVWMAL